MDPNELLLVMTICKLLGTSVKPRAVRKAYEDAKRDVELEHQGPREAR